MWGPASPHQSINSKTGYSQTWSFGIQRELPWGLVLDAHYWGSKSTHLPVSWNLNQLPDRYLPLGSGLNNTVPNPFYNVITNGTLSARTTTRQQLFLPFPQYTSITQVFVPVANSTYEAGTLQLEKRLSPAFTFLAAYTRSKAIDDVRTPYDLYNRRLEKGLSGFDAPNQFRFSGVWNVPFGRNRAFGKGLNPVLDLVLGGWDLSGIVTVQSGFPISISRNVTAMEPQHPSAVPPSPDGLTRVRSLLLPPTHSGMLAPFCRMLEPIPRATWMPCW